MVREGERTAALPLEPDDPRIVCATLEVCSPCFATHVYIFPMFDVGRAHVNDMVGVVVGSPQVAKLPM